MAHRTAVTVLPDAARWRKPHSRTFATLHADVHRYANLLYRSASGAGTRSR